MRSILPNFPGGAVGVGLLLLRLSVALSLLATTTTGSNGAWAWLADLSAIILIPGLNTRFAAGLGLGLTVIAALNGGVAAIAIAQFLATAAVILVGPGAYSIDSLIFGRHTVRLTHKGRDPGR